MVWFIVDKLAMERGIETAADLAREINRDVKMGQSTVYNLWFNKRDDFTLSTLRAVAKALNVSVDELYTESESHNNDSEDKIVSPRFAAA